jgi:ligand-binding sensor domain-containing protein
VYNPAARVSNRIDKLICDKYDFLWIATEADWSFPYNLSLFRNGSWKNVSDIIPGFPHPFIRDIAIDNNNVVWLATQMGVISIKYAPK